MLLQIALLHEFFGAFIAPVGLNSLMHPHMIKKVACLGEMLVTAIVFANVGINDFLEYVVAFLDPFVTIRLQKMYILLVLIQVQSFNLFFPLVLLFVPVGSFDGLRAVLMKAKTLSRVCLKRSNLRIISHLRQVMVWIQAILGKIIEGS